MLLNWTGCGKIFWALTLAWWPGAWSWPLAGFALTLQFERRWFRPRQPAMRRSRPSSGRRPLETPLLGEAADARGRCKELESELQGLQDQLAEEVRIRQEKEEDLKACEAAIKDRDIKLNKRHHRLGELE